MFTNLHRKAKKISIGKQSKKSSSFSNCPSIVFALYTLISPNLQTVLKKKLHSQVDLKE